MANFLISDGLKFIGVYNDLNRDLLQVAHYFGVSEEAVTKKMIEIIKYRDFVKITSKIKDGYLIENKKQLYESLLEENQMLKIKQSGLQKRVRYLTNLLQEKEEEIVNLKKIKK